MSGPTPSGLSRGQSYNIVDYAPTRADAESKAVRYRNAPNVARVIIDRRGTGSWKYRIIAIYGR